jgi:hypothetical protein
MHSGIWWAASACVGGGRLCDRDDFPGYAPLSRLLELFQSLGVSHPPVNQKLKYLAHVPMIDRNGGRYRGIEAKPVAVKDSLAPHSLPPRRQFLQPSNPVVTVWCKPFSLKPAGVQVVSSARGLASVQDQSCRTPEESGPSQSPFSVTAIFRDFVTFVSGCMTNALFPKRPHSRQSKIDGVNRLCCATPRHGRQIAFRLSTREPNPCGHWAFTLRWFYCWSAACC